MRDPWAQVVGEIRSFQADVRDLPVSPSVRAHELRSSLEARYDFEGPVAIEPLITEVTRLLRNCSVHVVHPRYFGLFNPSVRNAGIIGDTLAALYNPQLAVWSHAPAAQELERLVLTRLTRVLGMDPESAAYSFTTGGTEANLSAVLSALARAFPETARTGLARIQARPVMYLSEEGHDSFMKIARMTGMGTDAVRTVRVDARFMMDAEALEKEIRRDVADGNHPLLVVATAGTTGTGAVDPLQRLGEIAREAGAWFHVDAAWGGAAVLSSELRPALAGIEEADSVTWDAHKWLSVPMGAGMFFCRHPDAVRRAFSTTTSYMPPATTERVDPYQMTPQWSRRAIGLKVFLSLAEVGLPGYADMIEHQMRMADLLRSRLTAAGWSIANDTPLPLVCFTHPYLAERPSALQLILNTIHRRGRVWISSVAPSRGEPLLRACVTSFQTESADVDCLVSELERALVAARNQHLELSP